jgi:hypothetical protein
MDKNIYPISPAGLEVPVLIGLDGQDSSDLVAAGQVVPNPIMLRGILDTGSSVTAVAPWVFQRLGLSSKGKSSTTTAGGQMPVELFRVSIAILPPSNLQGPSLTLSSIWASGLSVTIPDADVLIGLNVLRELKLILDGPAHIFSLEF